MGNRPLFRRYAPKKAWIIKKKPAPRIEVISRPEAADLKNFATSITGENFANSDKLGVVGRRCVEVSVANGTPAPHNKILPKMSRCPADGLWLQPAGTLRSVSGAPVPCGVTCAAVRR